MATYSLWKSSSIVPDIIDNEPGISRQVFLTAWDISNQSALIYGVRVYAIGSMVGASADVGIILPSTNLTISNIASLQFTQSKTVTLSSGWNTILFTSPLPPNGATRFTVLCRNNGGQVPVDVNMGQGIQPVPGATYTSLSPGSSSGKVPNVRAQYFAYNTQYGWDVTEDSSAYLIEPIVGVAQTATPGQNRAHPLRGLPVGTTAGTVAAGNDSRFLPVGTTAGTVAAGNDPRITYTDSYGLLRPRMERIDMWVEGNLTVKTQLFQRPLYGAGTIRRVYYRVGAAAASSTVNISLLLNATAMDSRQLNYAVPRSEVQVAQAVATGDTLSLSITSVTGTIDGLSVSAWVEYV